MNIEAYECGYCEHAAFRSIGTIQCRAFRFSSVRCEFFMPVGGLVVTGEAPWLLSLIGRRYFEQLDLWLLPSCNASMYHVLTAIYDQRIKSKVLAVASMPMLPHYSYGVSELLLGLFQLHYCICCMLGARENCLHSVAKHVLRISPYLIRNVPPENHYLNACMYTEAESMDPAAADFLLLVTRGQRHFQLQQHCIIMLVDLEHIQGT
jgi:hypothetical protein